MSVLHPLILCFVLQILIIDHVWNICLFEPLDSQDEEGDPGLADQGSAEAGVPRLRLSWSGSGRTNRKLLHLGELTRF